MFVSRSWVVHLQEKVRGLETELARLTQEESAIPDAAHIVREAGLVRFEDSREPRFLGPSSGIAMSRLVLELAKQSSGSKYIRGIVPVANDRSHPTSPLRSNGNTRSYPIHSTVEPVDFPSLELTEKLVEVYLQTAQYMLPTLHEPTFRRDVTEVYNGSTDPYKNFVLKIVIAISMQKLHVRWAGVADSWYLAAMRHFEAVVQPMNLRTLQCFVLVAQYAVLTPTRTALYYVAGLASGLCLRLGLHRDDPVANGFSSKSPNALERDMRCRLFWVVNSMEFGISHTLGRPSAFSIPPDCTQRQFFAQVDDKYITEEGILPGPRSLKKVIAIHFFKMRLLQAEIKIKLYQQERDAPSNDDDPWFTKMEAKLDKWWRESPQGDDGSGLTPTWFKGKLNGMYIFLYRPCLHIPHPSVKAALRCYEASTFEIAMSGMQVEKSLVDITWVFIQTLFMALNTLLWVLSYPEVRKQYPKGEVERHLNTALETLASCSERWPEVHSALELYRNLSMVSLRVYEADGESTVATSPSLSGTSFASPEAAFSVSPYPSPPAPEYPQAGGGQPFPNDASYAYPQQSGMPQPESSFVPPTRPGVPQQVQANPIGGFYDPNSVYNMLPAKYPSPVPWDLTYSSTPAVTVLSDGTTLNMNESFFTPTAPEIFGQPLASQSQNYGFQTQEGLNKEDHMALTNSLETDGLVDLGNILQQTADFFGQGDIS
ncbi:MAG: hypothetical protein M4579_003928 [Chaenotheca gracillima]|nr:MAG: hypothetical protein M4579_003928 [Chaenotheca gracillima]